MTETSFNTFFKKLGRVLSSPRLTSAVFVWLMVLLLVGTISQKEIGLYHSLNLFFSSWIFWLGWIPLPGGMLTLSVFFVNLAVKVFFYSPWTWGRGGVILIHLSIMVLLIGGLVTSLTRVEGFMPIPEGETRTTFYDYHHRQLMVFRDGNAVAVEGFNDLEAGQEYRWDEVPFALTVEMLCDNCDVYKLEEPLADGQHLGTNYDIASIDPFNEDEENVSGLALRLSEPAGRYILFERMKPALTLTQGDTQYEIRLQRKPRKLPFSLTLKDFQREIHPGTTLPKAYASEITVTSQGAEWPVRIAMNQPLRHRGYTFYQSSFMLDAGQAEVTELTVVRDRGAFYPYLASGIMFIGFLWHLAVRSHNARRRELGAS